MCQYSQRFEPSRSLGQDVQRLGDAVDAAFEACLAALGTSDFPRCLYAYHAATERLTALRVDLAGDQERRRRQRIGSEPAGEGVESGGA